MKILASFHTSDNLDHNLIDALAGCLIDTKSFEVLMGNLLYLELGMLPYLD